MHQGESMLMAQKEITRIGQELKWTFLEAEKIFIEKFNSE
jgi:hypothetical protein